MKLLMIEEKAAASVKGKGKGKRAAKPRMGVCLGGYGQDVELVDGAVKVFCLDCGAYAMALDMVEHFVKNDVSACHPPVLWPLLL